MTTENEIQKLLIVQAHDLKIRQAEKELKDIPQRKAREQSRLEGHTREFAEAEAGLKHIQSELKKLELDAETVRARISKVRQQQLELKSNEAFRVSESEITTYQREIAGLEDKQLGMMEQLESARRTVEEKKKALAAEKAVVDSDCAAWDARAGTIKAQADAEKRLRDAAVQGVSPEWLSRYSQIWERKDKALVPLEQGICGGCHMQQPPYVVHDVRKRTAMVACGFCGRLLFFPS